MSEETLTSVFVGMRKNILRFASRFFPTEEDADDALQEAFCRLWPKRDELESLPKAEAMVKTAVRNIGIDAYRRHRGFRDVPLEEEAVGEPADSGEDSVEERFRAVERAIAHELTPLQQEIFRRKEYASQGFKEIAAALGMQEAAVRMQLSRARKTIRANYQKYAES